MQKQSKWHGFFAKKKLKKKKNIAPTSLLAVGWYANKICENTSCPCKTWDWSKYGSAHAEIDLRFISLAQARPHQGQGSDRPRFACSGLCPACAQVGRSRLACRKAVLGTCPQSSQAWHADRSHGPIATLCTCYQERRDQSLLDPACVQMGWWPTYRGPCRAHFSIAIGPPQACLFSEPCPDRAWALARSGVPTGRLTQLARLIKRRWGIKDPHKQCNILPKEQLAFDGAKKGIKYLIISFLMPNCSLPQIFTWWMCHQLKVSALLSKVERVHT